MCRHAIGYVKVNRSSLNCIVEARVTPETSVNNTPYVVSVTIDEITKDITASFCNCQASMGKQTVKVCHCLFLYIFFFSKLQTQDGFDILDTETLGGTITYRRCMLLEEGCFVDS